MPPPAKKSASFDQPPTCTHNFHTQTLLFPLPPLYFTPSPSATVSSSTLALLTQSLSYLGTPHTHTPSMNRDIVALRKELEAGMSRERRQMMQFYILSIKDTEKRQAAELYLARYKGFVIGLDGRLGYRLEEEGNAENVGKAVDGAKVWGEGGWSASCGLM